MKNYQQNQLNNEALERVDLIKTKNTSNINNNSQKQQQNLVPIHNQQKNFKTQLQKHREELDILELQIQQEQKNGFGNGQYNINKMAERKSQSLKRQPLSNSNSIAFQNQQQSQEQNRFNNFSPVKRLSNNQVGGTLNQSKPLGILLSQAGQDSIKPQKNKVSIAIDNPSLYVRNQPNNSVTTKQNEQTIKYPPLSTGSGGQYVFRPSVNSQHLNQIQNSNIYESGTGQSKLVNYPFKQGIGYNQQEQTGGNNLSAYSGDIYAQKYTGVNKFEKQLPSSQSQSILKNNQLNDQNNRSAIKNSYQTISHDVNQNSYSNQKAKQQKGTQQNQEAGSLPHYLKDLQVVKLPNEDEVHFDELNLQTEAHLLDKYSEFMNNDNDLFYLEGNFNRLYSGSVQNYFKSEQKDSYAFKGALAVCFDTQNPQADYKYIHPNYKVSLNKIANNPMIYAGLASQSGHQNLDQSRISNSKITTPQSEYKNNNDFLNQDSVSNQSNLVSRDGAKDNQSAIKSQNISRAHTNSTNTNQYFFNRKNFQIPQISGGDLMSELQSIQNEFRTHKVYTYNIFIVTKFKVKIDIGFLQVSFNMNTPNTQKTYTQCIIHRLYISRIYRKLNYAHFIYLQVYNFLFATYPNLEKLTITLSSHSQQYLKFNQSIGFRLENVKQIGDQNVVTQQIRLILKRSDFGQILTHIQSKKYIEKPGLDNKTFIQNKIPSNNLIPSY